jgi:hypothetical protein
MLRIGAMMAFRKKGATMARPGDQLTSALEAEVRAHQQVGNIGDVKTVRKARQQPDEDEILRLHQACEALVQAAKAIEAAVCAELMTPRKHKAA